MDVDFPRRRSATPEGSNPQGQNPGPTANPGNVDGGSNVHETEVPRRTDKDSMLPEDPANQDYTKGAMIKDISKVTTSLLMLTGNSRG